MPMPTDVFSHSYKHTKGHNITRERKPNSYRGDGDLYKSTRVHDDKKNKIKKPVFSVISNVQ